jgi:hypothetical protein
MLYIIARISEWRVGCLAPGRGILLYIFQQMVCAHSPPFRINKADILTEKCDRRIVNSFGAFQTYYKTDLLQNSSESDISWIGSVQAFLLLLVGAATGPIFDAGYFRTLMILGTFLMVFGMMMVSISSEYWHFILSEGIVVGVGGGALFVPSVAVINTYFTTKKALVTGIAACWSSIGPYNPSVSS